MASSPYHVSSYIFSHISHIFPLLFSPIFLIYFRRNFPMRFPHPNKNSHTCRSGWQDIAFTQPPKIFAHFRDISFISLQHFEVLLNKQLVFSRIVGTILFWEILISAQVREGLLCWVGLDEEGHSKCQHKQCSFSYISAHNGRWPNPNLSYTLAVLRAHPLTVSQNPKKIRKY